MQSNIDHTLIQQLSTDAEKDGVQKLVVGAVICINNKFLLIERVLSDFMGGFSNFNPGGRGFSRGNRTIRRRNLNTRIYGLQRNN